MLAGLGPGGIDSDLAVLSFRWQSAPPGELAVQVGDPAPVAGLFEALGSGSQLASAVLTAAALPGATPLTLRLRQVHVADLQVPGTAGSRRSSTCSSATRRSRSSTRYRRGGQVARAAADPCRAHSLRRHGGARPPWS